MGPNSAVQEYCLRWNNHHSTLVSVMDALLQKGTLVDVTLAAEGKSIQVHRLVLCACSNYFQELLSLHWDKQAVVFLKDVKFDHLQALVDYMYRGEVNVSQDQLAAFLNTAEALKIKGLADGDRDRKNEKRILEKAMARSSSPSSSLASRAHKRVRKQSKEDSPLGAENKTQLPQHQLPSLVRIPPITTPNTSATAAATLANSSVDRNNDDSPAPSPADSQPNDDEDDMHSNSAADNLNVEIDDGEEDYRMVEPKMETELEADYSGASGDEEDWSDSEYPSRIDTSHGDQGWNDEDGHGEGQLHMDHGDMNNSARGLVGRWTKQSMHVRAPLPNMTHHHQHEGATASAIANNTNVNSVNRSKSRKKVLPNQLGRYECHRCGRSYNLYGNLRRHWRYDCGDQPPQFACTLCGRLFRRRSNLRAHAVRSNCQPLTPVNI